MIENNKEEYKIDLFIYIIRTNIPRSCIRRQRLKLLEEKNARVVFPLVEII
jgi:hypothetical protein